MTAAGRRVAGGLAGLIALVLAAPAVGQVLVAAAADSDSVATAVVLLPPTHYGIMRSHLPDDPGAPQVAVSRARYVANFGSRDGVRPGSIFRVYRGTTMIGLLRVERVYRDSASLHLVRLDAMAGADRPEPVRRGDLLYPHYVLLESVNFGTGKPVFSDEMHERLRYAARFILNNPDFPVLLEGHTDNTGRKANNITLSRQRAGVVRDYLHDIQRIPRTQMFTVGYADERPLASNATEEGRFLNRRVDVVMVHELPPEAVTQATQAAAGAATAP